MLKVQCSDVGYRLLLEGKCSHLFLEREKTNILSMFYLHICSLYLQSTVNYKELNSVAYHYGMTTELPFC